VRFYRGFFAFVFLLAMLQVVSARMTPGRGWVARVPSKVGAAKNFSPE